MSQTFIIEGSEIHDLASLYSEINRVFMYNENWQLAESLDAFNDLLYGDFGALKEVKNPSIIWKNFSESKDLLGKDFTIKWYQEKLKNPHFNKEFIEKKIEELKSGKGQTYFEIILEIFAEHPKINLLKA